MLPTPQRARVSASLIFFVYGLLLGTYFPFLPFVKDRFGVGEGLFSLSLLAAAVGALLSLPLAPLILRWIGSRKAIFFTSLFYLFMVFLMVGAPNFPLFVGMFFTLGLTISTWEVSANTQASEIENQMGKPIMSSIHGFWSLGTFVGSVCMAGWLALELNGLYLIWLLALSAVFVVFYVFQGLLRREQITAESTEERPPIKLRYLFYGPLLVIAVYQIIGFMLESSFQDWGAFLVRELVLGHGHEIVPESQWDQLPAEDAQARRRAAVAGGLVLGCFTGTMTLGRMMGDFAVARLGRAGTLQIGGLIAMIGIVLATLPSLDLITYIGFALVGLGTANVAPQVIKTADSTPGLPPGVAIAIITAVGLIAFMAGPVTIGFSGELFSFRRTFLVLMIFPAFLLTAGIVLRWFEQSRTKQQD